VTLVIANSTMLYATGIVLSYRFEVTSAAGTVIENVVVAAGSGTTSRTIAATLDGDQTYQWRARAEYQGEAGPWSARQSFIAPATEGYIRGGELYDPLISGMTIGEIHGPVTFIPGVGVRLDSQSSYIAYRLQSTVTQGEISMLMTNVKNDTSGLKTKVFSMSTGSADMTTDPRRFTIEKRGSTEPGSIAWRVISDEEAIETIGNERRFLNFNPAATYFWRATWGAAGFRLIINEGGVSGRNIYDFPREYDGVYDPNPHWVYLGSPEVRGGIDSQTTPDVVIRQLWVSPSPRPSFANQ
jgi:hypothetical protein